MFIILLIIFCYFCAVKLLKLHRYMEKESIFRERACSISFVEVKVLPPQSERFYQLVCDGNHNFIDKTLVL